MPHYRQATEISYRQTICSASPENIGKLLVSLCVQTKHITSGKYSMKWPQQNKIKKKQQKKHGHAKQRPRLVWASAKSAKPFLANVPFPEALEPVQRNRKDFSKCSLLWHSPLCSQRPSYWFCQLQYYSLLIWTIFQLGGLACDKSNRHSHTAPNNERNSRWIQGHSLLISLWKY